MAYREFDSQRNRDKDRVRFEMIEKIGLLSTRDNGWRKEVNIVAWNGGEAKVDIREWDPKHERMTKGVTLFEEEAQTLAAALARRYGLRLTSSFAKRTAPPGGSSAQGRTFVRPEAYMPTMHAEPVEEDIPFDRKTEAAPQERSALHEYGKSTLAVAEGEAEEVNSGVDASFERGVADDAGETSEACAAETDHEIADPETNHGLLY